MTHTQAIDLLIKNIENLELPQINRLKHLDNQKPTIYLCGKSSSGKTTFLNALFNMERDELFTSTNISTKTEFRFQFGEQEIIEKSDGSLIILPDNPEERKLLFKSLNEEGSSYSVELNQEALKNRIIVDIPGVLDFKRNNDFSNRMLDEADIVYFFTPCTAKINESEYNLLESVAEAGIPIIVLFTMGDITEVDEGITRKTIPKLVQDRLSSCFKNLHIEHHQIISSNDFYKNKDSHGIDVLQKHILVNDNKYKQVAEKNRLNKTVQHYKSQIETKLNILNTDSEIYRKLVNKENKLWYNSEKESLEKDNLTIIHSINHELEWLIKNCDEQIFGNSYLKIFAEQKLTSSEQEKSFQLSWINFWSNLTNEFEFLQIRDTKLPPIPETLFKQISVDIDKLKEFLGINTNQNSNTKNDMTQDSKSKTEKVEVQKEFTATVQNKKKSQDEEIKNQSANNISGWKNLSWTDFIPLALDAGININNAKIIWDKWTYLNEVKAIIDKVKDGIIGQVENEFRTRLLSLGEAREKKIEIGLSKDPTIVPKSKYNESLSQLNII